MLKKFQKWIDELYIKYILLKGKPIKGTRKPNPKFIINRIKRKLKNKTRKNAKYK